MPTTLRVLIVDDCKDTARSLAMLMELWGYQAWVAHDGPQAVALAQSCQPDVVLLDIGLPQLNGFDVARRLRAQQEHPRPLIVAITGYALEQDRHRAQQAGFDLHLLKPVHPDALRDLLHGLGNKPPQRSAEDDGPPSSPDGEGNSCPSQKRQGRPPPSLTLLALTIPYRLG